MIPLDVVIAVAGLLLVRSGNAPDHCSVAGRPEDWVKALGSLNRYFAFQFVVMGVAALLQVVLFIMLYLAALES